MTVLADLRTAIAERLTDAGLNAYATVPAKWTPPGVFVGPGDPYITHEEGTAFGVEVIRHQVTVVAAPGTNDIQADALDSLILNTLDALYDLDDHDVGDVERPGQVSINGQAHLAVAITLSTQIRR